MPTPIKRRPMITSHRVVVDSPDVKTVMLHVWDAARSSPFTYADTKSLYREYISNCSALQVAEASLAKNPGSWAIQSMIDYIHVSQELVFHSLVQFLNIRSANGLTFCQQPGTHKWGWFYECQLTGGIDAQS